MVFGWVCSQPPRQMTDKRWVNLADKSRSCGSVTYLWRVHLPFFMISKIHRCGVSTCYEFVEGVVVDHEDYCTPGCTFLHLPTIFTLV
jgi:hypothetical protein